MLPATIWQDDANADLRSKRMQENILHTGDVLTIPDKEPHKESGATESRHTFRRKGVPAMLRIQILAEPDREPKAGKEATTPDESQFEAPPFEPMTRDDEPVKNAPFVLYVEGKEIEGTTDDDGRIEVPVPPSAKNGELIIHPGTEEEFNVPLNIGEVDPIDEATGVQGRLNNLGFTCEAEGATLKPALRQFQEKYGLKMSGEADLETKQKLEEVHGS